MKFFDIALISKLPHHAESDSVECGFLSVSYAFQRRNGYFGHVDLWIVIVEKLQMVIVLGVRMVVHFVILLKHCEVAHG